MDVAKAEELMRIFASLELIEIGVHTTVRII